FMKTLQFFPVLVSLLFACTAHAQPFSPQTQREEVTHLLEFIEQSNCQFNRNGSWHQSRDARLHLQKKYDYLGKRDLVPDAERFIERAASQSSMSRQAYKVRCADGKEIASASWLTEELARYRKARAKQAPQ
ncbi:MAG: hypothetical protein V7606_394, partial [Burkholderiales bacterium]